MLCQGGKRSDSQEARLKASLEGGKRQTTTADFFFLPPHLTTVVVSLSVMDAPLPTAFWGKPGQAAGLSEKDKKIKKIGSSLSSKINTYFLRNMFRSKSV